MTNPTAQKLLQSPFITQNFEQQISTSLQAFEQLYEKRDFEEAFEHLYLSLALLEQTNNLQLEHDVLKSCVKASSIVMSIKGSQGIISTAIAKHSSSEHFENLSMCYYLLSQSMLFRKNYEEAIMHAKMAYFYAKQITSERYFYECNAQLQLVCTLLEAKKFAEAKDYIGQFSWYLEHCTNDVERVFVLSIQASLQLLDGQQDVAVATMKALLEKFQQSHDIMYTSFLAMHFLRMLQLKPEYQLQYQAVINACEQFITQFMQLSDDISSTIAHEYTVHSNYFYRRAYQIVEEHNKQQQGTFLLKFKLLNQPGAIEQLLTTYKEKNVPHLLYQYASGYFMFITSADGKMLFHSFMQAEKKAALIHSVLMKHAADKNFFDLYNELNASILRKNLAQL